MIPFNKPGVSDNELEAIKESLISGHISGCGPFTERAETLLAEISTARRALLTTSCTHALEISAVLLDIKPGDEVIVPSFTFVSTALAYLMHGAKPVFCDIRRDTLNIDETQIESLITSRTKAIVVVHYAGVACDMNAINAIARRYNLVVVEDNAHGLFGDYQGKPLGSVGDMATLSFHETKNITCGEGGALLINNDIYIDRAEIIREKGTNRSQFFRGQVDKYTWVDKGSSYVLSDILAAVLYAQLSNRESIQEARRRVWETYNDCLADWSEKTSFSRPFVPTECKQAYHMFYLLAPNLATRDRFIKYLKGNGILSVFHYIPLHASPAAERYGLSDSECPITCEISDRLVRLPFFNQMSDSEVNQVVNTIHGFKN